MGAGFERKLGLCGWFGHGYWTANYEVNLQDDMPASQLRRMAAVFAEESEG